MISLVRLLIGTLQSIWLFLRKRPDAVFLTGGWVGLPVALAATLFHVPIVIFVPDIEPGLTLKVLGRFAKVITATTDDTQAFFPRQTVIETGYPLRPDLKAATRAAGVERFKLDSERPTLLVFGGSRGARSINRALLANIEAILQALDVQIIHVSGSLDWEEVSTTHASLPPQVQARYHVYEYLHDIGLAMAVADVVLSRAGASTLGEFPYFHLPSILVPYPYAWRYQKVNADWLVERDAAVRLDDERLQDDLLPTLSTILSDQEKQAAMAAAAAKLADKDGAEQIAMVILNLKDAK